MQATTYHPRKGENSFIGNAWRVKGEVRGFRMVMFAARSCKKGKPYIIAKGKLHSGRGRSQTWYGLLPVRRGRVCFQVIKGHTAVRTVSVSYKLP